MSSPRSEDASARARQAASAPTSPSPIVDPVLSAEALEGRRALSTAIVRLAPDGHLLVHLRDGREMALRKVTMQPRSYCGVQMLGAAAGAKHCGDYAEVVTASAEGGGAPAAPELPSAGELGSTRNPG